MQTLFKLSPALLLCGILFSHLADAEIVNAPKAAPPQDTLIEQQKSQEAFIKMPQEKQDAYIKHFTDASRLFQQKRIFECLDELGKADHIFNPSAEIYNLKGSCYVELRILDKALVEYQKAHKLQPLNPSLLFNIGEVYFVSKQWQHALTTLENVLKITPPQASTAFTRLVEFKILLCHVKLKHTNEVILLANKYDYLDESPFYYFAQSVLSFEQKNIKQSQEFLGQAYRVFGDPNLIAPWQDTLLEYGYNEQTPP